MLPTFGYFHVEAGNPIVGLWCDECSLPSVCEFPMYSVDRDGVGQVGTVVQCANYHEEDDDDDLVCQ